MSYGEVYPFFFHKLIMNVLDIYSFRLLWCEISLSYVYWAEIHYVPLINVHNDCFILFSNRPTFLLCLPCRRVYGFSTEHQPSHPKVRFRACFQCFRVGPADALQGCREHSNPALSLNDIKANLDPFLGEVFNADNPREFKIFKPSSQMLYINLFFLFIGSVYRFQYRRRPQAARQLIDRVQREVWLWGMQPIHKRKRKFIYIFNVRFKRYIFCTFL